MGVIRIFSAIWMMFFLVEFAVVYTRLLCRGPGTQDGAKVLPMHNSE